MRIGVFGGSFDPIHVGHLLLAEQCRDQARLDEVRFVPAFKQPLKQGQPHSPFERRVEMVQLAIAGHAPFRVDEIERERPGLSYTADTLAAIAEREPGAELFFLLGADCLPDLPRWHAPERIIRTATLLATARPGYELWSAMQIHTALQLPAEVPVRLQIVEIPPIDLASRVIRQRVQAGRSVRYMVPRAVEVYFHEKELYRAG
jgi:nicotinate-nucleotide adenylyltransferase